MKKSPTSDLETTFNRLKLENKDERWKYMDLKELLSQSFSAPSKNPPQIDPSLLDCMTLFRGGVNHYVFVNGVYQPKLSTRPQLGNGVLISPLSHALKVHGELVRPYLEGAGDNDKDAFQTLNDSSFGEGVFLFIPSNIVLPYPVHLWFLDADASTPQVFAPRNLFVVESHAKARVVVHREGFNKKALLMNSVSDVRLGSYADFHFMDLQKPAENAFHFHATRALLEEGSSFENLTTSWGNRLTRNFAKVHLNGKGASVALEGFSVLSGDQKLFNQTAVYHSSEETTSRQLFKNILSGVSRSEYSGLVSIGRHARAADSKQLNRNLVLSSQSRAYARPQLKIDTDDVKCSHGSTMGQLEGNELFYLRSRGIGEEEARSILMFGFAGEILRGVEPEFLRNELEREVKSRILS